MGCGEFHLRGAQTPVLHHLGPQRGLTRVPQGSGLCSLWCLWRSLSWGSPLLGPRRPRWSPQVRGSLACAPLLPWPTLLSVGSGIAESWSCPFLLTQSSGPGLQPSSPQPRQPCPPPRPPRSVADAQEPLCNKCEGLVGAAEELLPLVSQWTRGPGPPGWFPGLTGTARVARFLVTSGVSGLLGGTCPVGTVGGDPEQALWDSHRELGVSRAPQTPHLTRVPGSSGGICVAPSPALSQGWGLAGPPLCLAGGLQVTMVSAG